MRHLGRLAAGIVLLVTSAACAGGGGGNTAAAGDSGPIKIGGWLPLTGALANVGVPQKAGVEAFFGQLNASGGIKGRKVEWQGLDNAFDPQQTIEVARQLIARDKVVAVVGDNGTAQSAAAFPFVLDQSKVPILGPYAGVATWYDPPKPGLFGTFPLNEDSARAAARWAAEDGAKKVTIVRDDPESFKLPADAARALLTAKGVAVEEVVVKLNTTDYAPAAGQVKSQAPDRVITLLPTSEVAAYLKAAKLQGITAPAYGYAVTVSNALLDLAGADAEGFHGLSPTLPPTADDAAVKEYRDALAKYAPGQKPDYYSLSTYAYAKVFAQVVSSMNGPITSASIADAYKKANNVVTGIAGPMDFTKDQLGTHQLVRVQVANGQWVAKSDFVSGADT